MAQSSLVAKLQAASNCGDEATHQDRFTNYPHGFSGMIAEWEETVKKYAEQAESQNNNLAEDKELCALKQSVEAGIKTRSKEYAAMLRKMTPEQEKAFQSTKRDEREIAVSPRLGQRAVCLGKEEPCREAELEGSRC